jgi:hypothetical protein
MDRAGEAARPEIRQHASGGGIVADHRHRGRAQEPRERQALKGQHG